MIESTKMTMLVDGSLVLVIHALKVVRIMVVWTAIYIAEKILMDAFVSRSLLRDREPPDLRGMVFLVLAADGFAVALTLFFLTGLGYVYRRRADTFVIDGMFLRAYTLDYVMTSITFGLLGFMLAHIVQRSPGLRYNEDGMRGIRAMATIMLTVGSVILSLPMYRFIV